MVSNGWEYSFLQFYRTFPLLKELLGAILKEDGGKAVLEIQVLKFGIKDIGLIGKIVDFIVEGVPPLPLPIMTLFFQGVKLILLSFRLRRDLP